MIPVFDHFSSDSSSIAGLSGDGLEEGAKRHADVHSYDARWSPFGRAEDVIAAELVRIHTAAMNVPAHFSIQYFRPTREIMRMSLQITRLSLLFWGAFAQDIEAAAPITS
jgi:hypothetical protein